MMWKMIRRFRENMLTLLFIILLFMIFGKILVLAIKAAWGLSKIVCTIIFLPLILIGLVIKGLISVALPVLLIIGVVAVFFPKALKKTGLFPVLSFCIFFASIILHPKEFTSGTSRYAFLSESDTKSDFFHQSYKSATSRG